MSNRLQKETSPYLLQHAENPVDWYPWGAEAFERAQAEDKPVFLSIGYSTCHWCHVMAHECFEDAEIAALLNRYFIAVKVDKEERPDVDSVYMAVCQAFTGSGGWPTSLFLTPDKKPFFAGTYFPKASFRKLLTAAWQLWQDDREKLLRQAGDVLAQLQRSHTKAESESAQLTGTAVALYAQCFDRENGGFGQAPKFPSPHNLWFLLAYYERYRNEQCLEMAERTLLQMYRGGLFDHIGFGFCRYSTDERFLVPHFEKMLYDNALLIPAYCRLYTASGKKSLYLEIARKTADFILREMTAPEGGFYSALDADSEGEEGKYYTFTPDEIIHLLGQADGEAFNRRFGITEAGNWEQKSIPHLLNSDPDDHTLDPLLTAVLHYRQERTTLHPDDKILTAWNGWTIAALCELSRVCGNDRYLYAAVKAFDFIDKHLCEGSNLYVSYREGRRGVPGFLDDYAAYIHAALALYGATLKTAYLEKAKAFCRRVQSTFADGEAGGYFLYDSDSESLILRPKECYDGAMPSGNSLMAYNLVRLAQITGEAEFQQEAGRQLAFMAAEASAYPIGYALFLLALLEHDEPPMTVTVVFADPADTAPLPFRIPVNAAIRLQAPSEEYPLINNRTTYYVCRGHHCLPPTNDLQDIL